MTKLNKKKHLCAIFKIFRFLGFPSKMGTGNRLGTLFLFGLSFVFARKKIGIYEKKNIDKKY